MKEQVCKLCGTHLNPNQVQMGGMHVGCYEIEIDVYFIALPDAPKHGFFEMSIDNVAEVLKNMDDENPYLVSKTQMTAGRYFNLPEFEGF